jgi:DNA-directed RNA polymerase, mitochondrial
MLGSTCKKSVRLDVTLPSSSSYIRRTSTRTDHDRLRTGRRYSSATKRAEAPATATQSTPSHNLPPPFVPAGNHEPFPLAFGHLNTFLRQRTPLTIIPTPLPDDTSPNQLNDFFFPDSRSQDLLAIIDTCLNECYDVPRARDVFESMRLQGRGEFLLKIPLFNKFLQAYGAMAARHEQHRNEWIQEAWLLFNRMEAGDENAVPNAETYAIMALLWKRLAWMLYPY